MEARASAPRVGERLTTSDASLALMFGEVPVAVARLALCLRTQRRIGASHALLHLRRLTAACVRRLIANDSPGATEARRLAMALAQPLKELDDAVATPQLAPPVMSEAEQQLSFVHFQLWRLESLFFQPPSASAKAMT